MTLEAIHHRMDSEYSHALDEKTVLLRLRTQKDDVESCILHFGDRVDPVDPVPMSSTEMEKLCSDGLFDYYEIRLTPGFPRICYYFEIADCTARCFFVGGRFYDSPPANRTQYFQLAYLLREEVVKPPEWFLRSVVYQIFPDSFATGGREIAGGSPRMTEDGEDYSTVYGGTIRGITGNLPYLEELGIGCIYLNPIFSAASYHKYNTIDYRSIDPGFGDNASFRELVARAHSRGIKVILDGVFNHCGSGFFAFQDLLKRGEASRYRDWFYDVHFPLRYENPPSYATFAYVKEMPKLNTANAEVIDYFCEIGTYWIREADIDGWRLDVANEVGHDFWRTFRKRARAVKPDVVLIGEIWEDAHSWLQGDQFDSVMNYPFTEACRTFFAEGGSDAAAFAAETNALLMRYKVPIARGQLNLLDSHDVPRFLSWCGNDLRKLKLAALFQMTWVGVPSILYGDERAMSGRREHEYRRAMRWERDPAADALTEYYRRLIRIRQEWPALTSASVRTLLAEGSVLAFERLPPVPVQGSGAQERIVVVLNNGDAPATLRLPIGGDDCRVEELVSGRRLSLDDGALSITLEPYAGAILLPVSGSTRFDRRHLRPRRTRA